MVLCDRVNLCFSPPNEQAEAQRKRGYVEHIFILQLLTDTAKHKRKEPFLTYIDFSKGYDLVPRNILFDVLKQLGLRKVMSTLVAIHRGTQ